MKTQIVFFDDTAQSWERALYAFLAEKERRSGSRRTVESYSRMIQDFFGRMAKQPDEVTGPDVFAWAHGIGASGTARDVLQLHRRCLVLHQRGLEAYQQRRRRGKLRQPGGVTNRNPRGNLCSQTQATAEC